MQPLKKDIIRLLKEKKYNELVRLSSSRKKIISMLISLSYDKKSLISWQAIEAIGLITKDISRSDPEFVRNVVGRLLWMIRDESGGIGWSVPEILGEIVRNNPELCSDIASVIVSFHNEEMLREGVLRAIGRIGKTNKEMAEYATSIILPYLNSPDKIIRGNAAWALGEIGKSEMLKKLEPLRNDNETITFYEKGELREKTVGEIAEDAIEKLKSIMESKTPFLSLIFT